MCKDICLLLTCQFAFLQCFLLNQVFETSHPSYFLCSCCLLPWCHWSCKYSCYLWNPLMAHKIQALLAALAQLPKHHPGILRCRGQKVSERLRCTWKGAGRKGKAWIPIRPVRHCPTKHTAACTPAKCFYSLRTKTHFREAGYISPEEQKIFLRDLGISNREAGGKGASSIILKHHHNPERHDKNIQLRAVFKQAMFDISRRKQSGTWEHGNLKGESSLTNGAVSYLQTHNY